MAPTTPESSAVVVDVAYARAEAVRGQSIWVGALVDAIDAETVVVGGAARASTDVWRSVFADVVAGPAPSHLVVAYPSTWGRRRVGVLRDAVTATFPPASMSRVSDWDAEDSPANWCEFRPRAELIAQTHLEPSAQVCVVVEAHAHRLDVHRLDVIDGRWSLGSTAVVDADPGVAAVAPLIDDAVEAIIVDGENTAVVRSATALFDDAAPTGRIVAAERELIHRYGAAPGPRPFVPPRAPRSHPRGVQRWALGLGAALVVAVAAIAVVVVVRSDDHDTPDSAITRMEIGRVGLDVPAAWRRTSDPPGRDGVYAFTSIASPDDDRRLLVVENAVRADSTPATVATSLRNRLGQRRAQSVTEFSPQTSYAGREVISYRETPGSGAPIRWYVLVSDALQVSVGCQAGSRGEPIDDACTRAVSSLAIAPR